MRYATFHAYENAEEPRRSDSIADLLALLRGRRFTILSGAGCSTDSGIPDYRGPTGSLRKRQPIQYQDFLRSETTRRRYWARSTLGWRTIATARPNAAHEAIAALEHGGRLGGLITQNVDGLHQAAGSRQLVELHGSLHWVRCLSCEQPVDRASLQAELVTKNPSLSQALAASAPDGDADLDEALHAGFLVPACRQCGGVLKPDVVFFGENVPRSRVQAAWRMLESAEALLVLGSSLALFSGFRFVRGAVERDLPVALVNLGPTRADALAAVRVEAPVGPTLTTLLAALL
jgi:NAD-dependent SIR2 family protein deacetylase